MGVSVGGGGGGSVAVAVTDAVGLLVAVAEGVLEGVDVGGGTVAVVKVAVGVEAELDAAPAG